MMLFLGMGVPKNDVEGAAWLLVCDPGDDESLRTAIKDILEKLPADKLPIAKTCQPSKVCINTCYFSKGGSSRPASDRGRFVGPTVMLLACDGVRHK